MIPALPSHPSYVCTHSHIYTYVHVRCVQRSFTRKHRSFRLSFSLSSVGRVYVCTCTRLCDARRVKGRAASSFNGLVSHGPSGVGRDGDKHRVSAARLPFAFHRTLLRCNPPPPPPPSSPPRPPPPPPPPSPPTTHTLVSAVN